ncbi:MAG: ABC transporter ATP-binding protein [Simkaniaceae bacterium]
MKLLLQAALRTKKHFFLIIITFFTLFALTIANQMEMFTLGMMSRQGADFFSLFGNKEKEVRLQDVNNKWHEIAHKENSAITPLDANRYLSQKATKNPLDFVMRKINSKYELNEETLQPLIVIIICVAIIKAGCLFASRFASQLLSIRISRELRQQYFEHIQMLPMSFYQKYNIGSLSARVVADASQIALSLNSFMTNYLQTPFTIIASLVACFYLSWQLSLVIFIGLPMIILPVVFVTRKVKKIARQLQKNQERFTSVLIDFLAGIQTVKVFSMEPFSLKKYGEQNDKMAQLETKSAKYDLLTRPILHTVTTFCLALVLLVGLYYLHLNLSELIVFCGLLYLFYDPVKKFAEENANIQKGVVAAERLFEVLTLKPQIEDHKEAIPICNFSHSIEFDHVWFKYENKWVIKDLSFEVKKGETLAIVGMTGSGKSTIVQLIPRLYEPQKGEIRIDGRPLKAYTQKSLREIMGFVSQKPFLFYDTIASNISYGRPYSLEAIKRAAKKAHADEFIIKLPDGYQTMLAETGKNFSGGQQQRLAIARALVKEAPILILDEATSSLDAISEGHIKNAIMELHGDITQIIIAHRLSTIEHADRIIYLHDGEKIAEGSKEELLKNCPEFQLMWNTHYKMSGKNQTYTECKK